MKPPLFVRELSDAERRALQAGLRSREAFTMRRAQILRASAEGQRPSAIATRVVLDNLNTHTLGSLFATYPPAEAWRLRRRLEFHDTPKHASWLNMAECEWSVLSRQCLNRRLADRKRLRAEVAAWVAERNRTEARITWTFRVADARTKLAFLYPKELLR